MKKVLTICMAGAFVFSMAIAARAAAPKMPISGEVSLAYGIDKMNASGADITPAESAKQNFLPALSATINVAKPWAVMFSYDVSGSKALSPADPPDNTKVKSTQYMFGAKYGLPMGTYADLSYGEYKINMAADVAGNSGDVKFDGLRIGGGVNYDFAKTPFSVGADLGLGISDKAKWSVAGGSTSPKASRLDFCLKGSYKIGTTGMKADLGYSYINLKSKANDVLGSDTFKVKGPFIGVTYAF